MGIDGFDGDGLQTFINPPTGGATGYEGADSNTSNANAGGPMNSFSNLIFGNGVNDFATVNFPGGLPNGGSAFFSLERSLSAANFTVVITPTPEPATLSIVGAALAGFGMMRRRRRKAA